MSALKTLSELLQKEAGKPVFRAGGSQGALFRQTSQKLQPPGPDAHASMTSINTPSQASQSAAQESGARDALRQRLSRGAASNSAVVPDKVPVKLQAASEASRGLSSPGQKSVVIPEKGRPVQFEAKQQRQEAEAVVRGKDVSQQLGQERGHDIAQAREKLRGTMQAQQAANPSGSLVEKNRASQIERIKLDQAAKPSSVKGELNAREAGRNQDTLKRIFDNRAKKTQEAYLARRSDTAQSAVGDKTVMHTEPLGKKLISASLSPTLARKSLSNQIARRPSELTVSHKKSEPARALRKSPMAEIKLEGGFA